MELDVARQIGEGAVLYRDVRYFFGPLPPYLNALGYALFGVRAEVAMAAGVGAAALLCVLLYRTARLFLDRAASAGVTILFLYACAFAHLSTNGIFNFPLPYSCAATYGLASAFASVYFLLRFARKARPADASVSAVCLALAGLCRVEVLFAALVAHTVFFTGARMSGRFAWRMLWPYAAVAAVLAAVYGFFAWQASLGGYELLADNLFAIANDSSQRFLLQKLGLDDPVAALKALGISAGLLGAVVAAAGLASVLAARVEAKAPAAGWVAGAVVGAGAAWWYASSSLEFPFRLLPAAMALGGGVLLVRFVRRPTERAAMLPQLVFLAFAFAMLGRMLTKTVSYHYGFYMLPPALGAFGVLLFRWLPGLLPWRARAEPVLLLAGLGVLAGLAWKHYDTSSELYRHHTLVLDGPRGRMRVPASMEAQAEAFRFLCAQPPDTRVLVLPKGEGLTFLAGLDAPYGMHHYHPPAFGGSYSPEAVLARWQAAPPDVILLLPVDLMKEFGSRGFGQDYAEPCLAWIKANYQPHRIGPAGRHVLLLTPAAKTGSDTEKE